MKHLLFFLIMVFCFRVFGEGTNGINSGGQPNTGDLNGGERCLALENQFRSQLVASINEGYERMAEFQSCFSSAPKPTNHPCNTTRRGEVEAMMNNLTSYRESSRRMYTNIAENWLDNLPEGHREVANRCFRSNGMTARSDGSIARSGSVGFDGHLRTLRVQIRDTSLSCQPQQTAYAHQLSRAAADAMANPSRYGLSAQDIENINTFRGARIKQLMSDRTKYDPNLTDDELRASLYQDLSRVVSGIGQMRDRIQNLNDANLYQVYDFEGQYNNFLEGLNPDDRSFSESCKGSSGFLSNCTVVGAFSPRVAGRCGANAWGLAREMIPIVGLVDAMGEYQEAIAGEAAGVLSAEEADARNAAATVQFLFGLPMPPLTVAAGGRLAANAAARNAARGISDDGALTVARMTRGQREAAQRLGLSNEDYVSILNRTMSDVSLTPAQRRHFAGRFLDEGLSPIQRSRQLDAVMEAHNACQGTSFSCLRQKMEIMQRAGMNREQIQAMMDRGITGRGPGWVSGSVSFETPAAAAFRVDRGNALQAGPEAWRRAEYGFGVDASNPAASRPDTQGAISFLRSQYSQIARNLPAGRRNQEWGAWALSNDRDLFIEGVRDAGEARQIIAVMEENIRRLPIDYTTARPAPGNNNRHWFELGEYRQRSYQEMINSLRSRFNL